MDRFANLEDKIASAIERVKALKEEKDLLALKIKDIETSLNEKNQEIETIRAEKSAVVRQLEELLGELERLDI